MRSRSKKVRACRGAAARGRPEAARGLVYRATRPRSEETRVHRRDRASTNLARKNGRCRRGRRLRAAIPHSHYKTITLVAGLRLSGLVAQKAFDQPMTAAKFEEWVENGSRPNSRPATSS